MELGEGNEDIEFCGKAGLCVCMSMHVHLCVLACKGPILKLLLLCEMPWAKAS